VVKKKSCDDGIKKETGLDRQRIDQRVISKISENRKSRTAIACRRWRNHAVITA
jgi:hypothetical protein